MLYYFYCKATLKKRHENTNLEFMFSRQEIKLCYKQQFYFYKDSKSSSVISML